MLSAQLFRFVLLVTGRLPLRALQVLGALCGDVLWLTNTRMAKVTRENIALSFPDLPREAQLKLARQSLRETGKNIFETAKAWTAPRAHCEQLIKRVHGGEAVDQIIASGQGVIFVIPHLGSWEMITHVIGSRYQPVHMYRANPARHIEQLVLDLRQRTGAPLVPADRHGIKAQLDALNNARTISAMPDQEPGVHTGEFAPFFGVSSLTSTLIPGLTSKTGARPVLAYCERLGHGAGFEVHLVPVELPEAGTFTTANLNRVIESAVRRIPEQYLWSYKRFKTRPPGGTEYYQFRQSGLRQYADAALINVGLALGRWLPLDTLRALGARLADLARLAGMTQSRNALTNLTLCARLLAPHDINQLHARAFRESGKTLLETGKIWGVRDATFEELIQAIHGLEHLAAGSERPILVLTPPLGNREVLMRFLASQYKVTEYFYPHSHFPRRHTAADDATRTRRKLWNIELVTPGEGDIDALHEALRHQRLVTLCPDQQPRLRSGEFIPFLGIDALTNREISRFIRESGATVVFGAAIRQADGFEIYFHPLELPRVLTDPGILAEINGQLEKIVLSHLTQYRWSDKRFNIRPNGEPKVYRRAT